MWVIESLDRGVLVSAAKPDTERLATMLGVHRFDGFRLPIIDNPQEEEPRSELEDLDEALA